MKLQFKTLIILIFLPAMLLANFKEFNGKYTKEKTLKKEYPVNNDAELNVSNSFGNIDIVTWNENRIVIEVHITTNGDNEEKVQQKLDEISVEFSGSASLVTAKTKFKDRKGSWSWWGNKNKNVQMEINYTIKLPITNSVDLNNDYGAISLDKLDGIAKINCDYGQLLIGELRADNNNINFDYTKNSNIAFMKSGKINADYSGFTLEKAERLELNADYTKSEIHELTSLNFNCDYGKVIVQKSTDVNGRGDYVTTRIGSLSGSLTLNADYGSIKVDELTQTAKNVEINGDYTGIKLGFSSGYNFDFNIDLTYASFNGDDLVTVTKSAKDNGRKSYSGYHGTHSSGNTITIKTNYGGVSFLNN